MIPAADRRLRALLRSERGRRRLSFGYAAAAVLLLPWIAVLFLTQRYTGTAEDLVVVTIGIPVLIVVALVLTAWLYLRSSPGAAVAATFAAAAIGVTEWFHLLTGATRTKPATYVTLGVLIVGIALLARIAHHSFVSSGLPRRHRRPIAWLLVALAVLLAAAVTHLALHTEASHAVRHLRLVWTGLDVFEFVGLAATAWGLRTSLVLTAVAGAYTAALLFADAWFNVTASSGSGRAQAVAMAFVEVPIALVSLRIAWLMTVSIEQSITVAGDVKVRHLASGRGLG